jgi:hypothetical protein
MYLFSLIARKREVIIPGKCGTGPGTIAGSPAGMGEVVFSSVTVDELVWGVDGTLAEWGPGGVPGGPEGVAGRVFQPDLARENVAGPCLKIFHRDPDRD